MRPKVPIDTREYFDWFVATAADREKRAMHMIGCEKLVLTDFPQIQEKLVHYLHSMPAPRSAPALEEFATDFATALGNGFIRDYPRLHWLFYTPNDKDDLDYHRTVLGYFAGGAVMNAVAILQPQLLDIIAGRGSNLPSIVDLWRSWAEGASDQSPRINDTAGNEASDPVKYDDASWHYLGTAFPRDLEPSAGATHAGMFLVWAILSNLSKYQQQPLELQARTITPGAFLLKERDGKFLSSDLNARGNAFAKTYFALSSGQYLNDYERILGPGLSSSYLISDSWENFDKLKPVLDQRFAEWSAKQSV